MHEQDLELARAAAEQDQARASLRHRSGCMERCSHSRGLGALGRGLAIGELDPGRGVVARLLPTAHVAVHPGRDQAAGERRLSKQVIDAQAGVAGPGFRK